MGGQVGRPTSQMIETVSQMHRAGEPGIGCGPRDGGSERPINLDRPGIPLKSDQIFLEGRRKGRFTEKVSIQLGGVDIGQDRMARQHFFTANRSYADRPTVSHDDLLDAFTAPELPTGTLKAIHQRRGKRARTTFRDRKTYGLCQGTHHPSEESAACRLRTEIGMESVACQEQGPPSPQNCSSASLRTGEMPSVLAREGPSCQPVSPTAIRHGRGGKGLNNALMMSSPTTSHRDMKSIPARAVPGCVCIQAGRRPSALRCDDGTVSVGCRMSQRDRAEADEARIPQDAVWQRRGTLLREGKRH